MPGTGEDAEQRRHLVAVDRTPCLNQLIHEFPFLSYGTLAALLHESKPESAGKQGIRASTFGLLQQPNAVCHRKCRVGNKGGQPAPAHARQRKKVDCERPTKRGRKKSQKPQEHVLRVLLPGWNLIGVLGKSSPVGTSNHWQRPRRSSWHHKVSVEPSRQRSAPILASFATFCGKKLPD
jgi:hypothetical protein